MMLPWKYTRRRRPKQATHARACRGIVARARSERYLYEIMVLEIGSQTFKQPTSTRVLFVQPITAQFDCQFQVHFLSKKLSKSRFFAIISRNH